MSQCAENDDQKKMVLSKTKTKKQTKNTDIRDILLRRFHAKVNKHG